MGLLQGKWDQKVVRFCALLQIILTAYAFASDSFPLHCEHIVLPWKVK